MRTYDSVFRYTGKHGHDTKQSAACVREGIDEQSRRSTRLQLSFEEIVNQQPGYRSFSPPSVAIKVNKLKLFSTKENVSWMFEKLLSTDN
jgi:hypothetical protein